MSFYKKITKNVDIVLSISVLIIICVFVYKNSIEYAEGVSEDKPGEKTEDKPGEKTEDKPGEKTEDKPGEKPKCEYPDNLWIEEKDGECVVGYDDLTLIPCQDHTSEESGNDIGVHDRYGFRIYKNKSLTPEACPKKTRQVRCNSIKQCPIDCVGAWSEWGKCIQKPCGEQPSESRFYRYEDIGSSYGGKECPFKNGQEQKRKCSEIVSCDA